ncbi:hypothetical protein H6503_00380 [Candidatus Woesearchaeota archaeon]|nr:hypothetical protein [Candidatus Woesearchaeota archaeon]
MQKPKHLEYLKRPVEWYITDHKERQTHNKRSYSVGAAFSIDELLMLNHNRDYKGIHTFCGAEEDGEIITCVIFKKAGKKTDYYHTLYLGPETQNPGAVEEAILGALGITIDQVQKSLIARETHCDIPKHTLGDYLKDIK